QKDKVFEVIVLDDNSEDKTKTNVEKYLNKIPNLKLIQGESLPDGWTGKNWACWQLFKESTGEILIFIDADTTLSEDLVKKVKCEMQENNVQLLSIYPKIKIENIFIRLFSTFTDWLILNFLPLSFVYKYKTALVSFSDGHFMAF